MKKAILIALIAISIGCKKSNNNNPTVDNSIKSRLIGTWTCTKNVTTYTDIAGKAQVYNNRYLYIYILTDKTASKMAGQNNIYINPAPYTVTTANGKNFINFYDNPGDAAYVDTYQIVSVTDHSLVLHVDEGNFNSGSPDFITGTNAVLDEEYSK
jgi:hypothetical protein